MEKAESKNTEKVNNAMVLGKKIYHLNAEERKQLMAEWRARRKGGNGRTGFRKPARLSAPTNNFEKNDPNNRWTAGKFKKDYNEHVKCMFICKREIFKSKINEAQTYFIGFLSDSNRFSFEEFRESSEGNEGSITSKVRYTLRKYFNIFGKKNIDKDTTIVLGSDEINQYSIIYLMVSFMRSFSNCIVKRAGRDDVLRVLMQEYQISPDYKLIMKNCKKYTKKTIYVYLGRIFDFVIENKLCPWLTEEDRRLVKEEMTLKRRRSYVLVHMGLLYALILVFKQFQKVQVQEHK